MIRADILTQFPDGTPLKLRRGTDAELEQNVLGGSTLLLDVHGTSKDTLPPNEIIEEPYATLEPPVRAELETRGYRFVNQGWNGDIQAIVIESSGVSAVSDPRGRGVARVLSPP